MSIFTYPWKTLLPLETSDYQIIWLQDYKNISKRTFNNKEKQSLSSEHQNISQITLNPRHLGWVIDNPKSQSRMQWICILMVSVRMGGGPTSDFLKVLPLLPHGSFRNFLGDMYINSYLSTLPKNFFHFDEWPEGLLLRA